jgi:hypothetical protein
MKKKMITGTGYEKTDTGGTNGSGEKGWMALEKQPGASE